MTSVSVSKFAKIVGVNPRTARGWVVDGLPHIPPPVDGAAAEVDVAEAVEWCRQQGKRIDETKVANWLVEKAVDSGPIEPTDPKNVAAIRDTAWQALAKAVDSIRDRLMSGEAKLTPQQTKALLDVACGLDDKAADLDKLAELRRQLSPVEIVEKTRETLEAQWAPKQMP